MVRGTADDALQRSQVAAQEGQRQAHPDEIADEQAADNENDQQRQARKRAPGHCNVRVVRVLLHNCVNLSQKLGYGCIRNKTTVSVFCMQWCHKYT
jgi:hypothetical protein